MPQSKNQKQRLKKSKPKTSPVSSNSQPLASQSSQMAVMQMVNQVLFFLLLLFLPTQLGKHFFSEFSYLSGVRIDYLAPTLYFTDILAGLLSLLNIKVIIKSLSSKWLWTFGLLLGLNIVFSYSPVIAIYKAAKYVELISLFIVTRHFILSQLISLKQLVIPLLIGSSVELLLALLQFGYKHSLQGVFYWLGERAFTLSTPDIAKVAWQGVEVLRPYGTFSHPNSLAGFYLLLYFFTLLYKPINKFLILKFGLLLIFSLLIFISLSKFTIIIFIILNIIYTLTHRTEVKCTFCVISRIIIFIVLATVFATAQGDPFSLQKRLELVISSLQIIVQNPLTGTGLGNYLYAQHKFAIHYPYFFLQPVHNIFLLFLAEAGILLGGAVMYGLGLWIKKNLDNKVFIYCLGVVILTGLFDHYWLTLQQNLLLIPIIFGLVASSLDKNFA